MKDFGNKISNLRKSKGMTQEDLGKVLNVTYQAVSKWERDESLPDIEMISRIAKYFEVPINYFVDDETAYSTASTAAPANNSTYIGVCTVCGKMLKEKEAHTVSPKILCKSCAERQKKANEIKEYEREQRTKAIKDKEIAEQCGHGVDFTLILSLIITAACFIGMTIMSYNDDAENAIGYAVFLFLIPLAAFGYTHSISTAIRDLKTDFDEDIGYTRNVSLISAGAVAVFNLACCLTLYFMTKETTYIYFGIGTTILTFTFVSQYMWGGVIQTIFTAGGFTFKIPGFIITLDIDSVIFMIIAKILLGILAALVMIVTTAIVIIVAVLVSVVTFIPSVISKSYKDTKVKTD